MEKLTSLGLSFDRVLIQLIIPGMVTLFPYLIIYFIYFPSNKDIILKYPSLFITPIVILSLIIGIFLENIGSIIEVNYYDKKNAKKYKNYTKTWEKFLMLNYNGKEPIGHRYIRNILIRMKFELSFGLSLIPFSVGLIIIDSHLVIFNSYLYKILCLILIPLIVSSYLIFKEAYSSSKVLALTRKSLVKKYYEL
jgi:hypothetical protein